MLLDVLVTLLLASNIQCGRVLFIPPLVSPSHKIAMANWADALAGRGHEVYWWAPATKLDKYQPRNVTYVDHFRVEVEDSDGMAAFAYENASDVLNVWSKQPDYQMLFLETRFNYLLHPFYESIAKNHKSSLALILSVQFDFVIMDELFNGHGYVVSLLLGSPPIGVFVSTCTLTTDSYRFNNVPVSPAYMPAAFDQQTLSDQMNLWERLRSTVAWWVAIADHLAHFNLLNHKMKTIFPSIQDVTKQLRQPDFQFICVNKQLEFPGPSPQNLIYVGGIQLSPTVGSLNEEWQSFVDSSKNGFILLAMGHWAKWTYAPVELKEAFLEAFKRVPKDYSIIWQYDDVPFENLPKNIKLAKWLPQRSLLANPNCKLFITHAGCNGVTEAVYHAVPMVAIPLVADQPDGAARVAKKGLGILLKKHEITVDSLLQSIVTVLKNESYGINARKFADNLKSDALTPIEKAVFWSEFAMRHHGGSYYKSTLTPTYFDWVRYYCIDFIIYCCIFLCVLVESIVRIISFFFNSRSNHVKRKIE